MVYSIDCGVMDNEGGGRWLPSEMSLSSWKRQSYSDFEGDTLRKVKQK